MRRREFMTVLGGAAAAPIFRPLAARAQQPQRVRRIAMLMTLAETDPELQARLGALRQSLEKLGWMDGRNLHVDYRFAPGSADQYQPLAKELVALGPDVIVVSSGPATAAIQRETRSI